MNLCDNAESLGRILRQNCHFIRATRKGVKQGFARAGSRKRVAALKKIVMMTKQQEALRIAAKFLYRQSLGYKVTERDCKMISDLCWLTLPMKYRMTKEEIARIKETTAMEGKRDPGIPESVY